MPVVDVVVSSEIPSTLRVRQLSAIFDVPLSERAKLEWHANIAYEDKPWNVGLIVGPSGSGKTLIAREMFGASALKSYEWDERPVVDNFGPEHSIESITEMCQAVGFNTIPAWMRPYRVLSNGEQFRVNMARTLLERDGVIAVDEFTSVVDRQVAKIVSNAIQKRVRKNDRQFVAVSCHDDIIEWLQPDWIYETSSNSFVWRSLRRRPTIDVAVTRVPYRYWPIFAPFHYLTADLNHAARCYVLSIDGKPAAFGGVLYRPRKVQTGRQVYGLSRLVTLPDYQGLGLAFALTDTLASAYAAMGHRFHTYPAHPPLIRSFAKSEQWVCTKKPGFSSSINTKTTLGNQREIRKSQLARPIRLGNANQNTWKQGARQCAIFEYVGKPMSNDDAKRLLS